jgi:predicted urease superfamily metal-dependent hydrolase
MKFYCDNKRHLVCVPYSRENLDKMAAELGIDECWFHKNHYDMPKERIDEITAKCEVVSSKEIVRAIRRAIRVNGEYVREHDWMDDGWRN